MGRRATKNAVADVEQRVSAAVNDYKIGRFRNIRDAATAYDLTYSKLRNRLAGVEPKGKAQVDQQILTPWEEKAIVKWILQLDDWGFPPRMKYVKDIATSFLRSHYNPGEKSKNGIAITSVNLGKNWTTRFLSRHPELDSKFAVRLDKQRGFANDPVILKDFFKKLFATISKYKILPQNIYNMDEKGFIMGRSTSVKVICRRGKKRNFKIQDGARELITVIETISAGGNVLPPSIIYKGVALYRGWTALVEAGDKAHFSVSSTGWSNQQLGLAYLTNNFEPNTRTLANDAQDTRLLILDGHTSHVTWEFFDHCLNNNIIPLCLPAHSTHLLQPLDVGLFGPLQHNYATILDDYLESGGPGIHKGTFYPLLVKARRLTYTQKNILSAFEATGIHPYRPKRVLNALNQLLNSKNLNDKVNSALAKSVKQSGSDVPALPCTPQHGRSVFYHTRKTLSLFSGITPRSAYKKAMVNKLANAAAQATAELVILKEEIRRLKAKATKSSELSKVKNRKVLSRALVVSAEDVVKLRGAQEEREQKNAEKKLRAIERKLAKEGKDAGFGPVQKDCSVPKLRSKKKKVKDIIPIVIAENGEEEEYETDIGLNSEEDSTQSVVEILSKRKGDGAGRTRTSQRVSRRRG